MRHARIFLMLFVAAAVLTPAPAVQAALAVNGQNICPTGTTGDPSGSKEFPVPTDTKKIDAYLKQKVMCPNACFNIRVSLSAKISERLLTIKTTASNACGTPNPTAEDAKNKNRGCSKGQTPPTIFVQSPAIFGVLSKPRSEGPRSRCDPAVSRVIGTFAQGDLEQGFNGIASLQAAATVQGPATVDLSIPTDRNQIAMELAAGTNISVDDAKAIVARDPEAAIKAINAISTGSDAEIKTAVAAIGLNPDLTDKAALQAVVAQNNGLPVNDPNDTLELSALSTFRQSPDEATGPNIAERLAPMCYQQGMGGCGNACNVPNPSTLTCAANNPGALTFTAWQTQYGGRPCGLANNTTCYDTIEGGIAAQANLLMTSPRYFGTGNNTILGAFCGGYTANRDQCAPYAAFISAQTGIPINQTIDPNNTEQIAAIMMASSRFENGRGVIYTPEQLQKGLQVALGTDVLPEGTPGYIPRTMYGTNGGTQFGSAFSMSSAAPPAAAPVGYGSPFAQGSNVPIAQTQTQSSVQQTAPVQISQQIQRVQDSIPSSSVAEQLQQALSGASSTPEKSPIAIIVQPKEVTKGEQVTVSWSSKGMSTEIPCVLRIGSAIIARKNQGASVVQTSPLMATGSLVFTLSCTTPSGTQIQRNAAVFVR
ncbi:hypothetical protein HY971_00520 [Candidatus Kaiserbacteria bacterium]|nr:hypothetical protein [Candidatus Kaiserbacteria bacterium]